MIHPTAIVHPNAVIDENVYIGPYCVVGENVHIKKRCHLHSHVVIAGWTTVDEECEIFPFAAVGLPCQDLKFKGEKSTLSIGKKCTIREHATLHPGTDHGGGKTVVGDHCLLMVATHVAHDCMVGNHVIMSNNATLAGHVVVEDHVVIGGLSAVHQFCRIGFGAMIGGMSGVVGDVIPFGMIMEARGPLSGLNIIGMRRSGLTKEDIRSVQELYLYLFEDNETTPLQEKLSHEKGIALSNASHATKRIVDFIKNKSKRPLCKPIYQKSER
jgi:UDP-N-acetylglucosamine acyltransferase